MTEVEVPLCVAVVAFKATSPDREHGTRKTPMVMILRWFQPSHLGVGRVEVSGAATATTGASALKQTSAMWLLTAFAVICSLGCASPPAQGPALSDSETASPHELDAGGEEAAVSDAGACAEDAGGTLCCLEGCGSRAVGPPVCIAGEWHCPTGAAPQSQCGLGTYCGGFPPPAPSSLRVCADPDAGVCLNNCDPWEVCFTQIVCGPPVAYGDGGFGWTCGSANFEKKADNRCHRICYPDTGCAGKESCTTRTLTSCSDLYFYMPICCLPGEC
jgi:hypothetical protein